MNSSNQTKSMTAKQAAEMMGVHVNTIRTMIEDGRLNAYKTNGEQGHWRIPVGEIELFMSQEKEKGETDFLNGFYYMLDDIPSILLNDSISSESYWQYINRYYGIRSVFGSQAIHAENEDYRKLIEGKGFIWLGEGATNYMEAFNQAKNNSKFHSDKFHNLDTHFGFGVVKAPSLFESYSYSLVPLLMTTDRQGNEWVVDGTLQQFYPGMEKGLVIMSREKAEQVYLNLQSYNKQEFAEMYSDPYISKRLVDEAKRRENGNQL